VNDACQNLAGCDTSISLVGDGNARAALPTYRCLYNDMRPSGCCTADSDCSTLSAENNCIEPTCDNEINQCTLSTDPSCCYYGAQCRTIANENNMCQYDTCSGPPSATVTRENAFKCLTQSTPGCTTAPSAGLVPAIAVQASQFACSWTCGNAGANVINVAFTVTNPINSNRKLYAFSYVLMCQRCRQSH
jgi:hypothetical protein